MWSRPVLVNGALKDFFASKIGYTSEKNTTFATRRRGHQL